MREEDGIYLINESQRILNHMVVRVARITKVKLVPLVFLEKRPVKHFFNSDTNQADEDADAEPLETEFAVVKAQVVEVVRDQLDERDGEKQERQFDEKIESILVISEQIILSG